MHEHADTVTGVGVFVQFRPSKVPKFEAPQTAFHIIFVISPISIYALHASRQIRADRH